MTSPKALLKELISNATTLENLTTNKPTFSYLYEGKMNYTVINSILIALKEVLIKENFCDFIPFVTRKRIYAITVEILYNAFKNSASPQKPVFLFFKIHKDRFIICCGNLIRSQTKEFIKNKIDTINQLSERELKELYFKELKNNFTEQGGAGLGLIEIGLKSTSLPPLNYEFIETQENNLVFFILSIEVKI